MDPSATSKFTVISSHQTGENKFYKNSMRMKRSSRGLFTRPPVPDKRSLDCPLQQENVFQRMLTWDGDICRRFIEQLWSIVQAPLEVHQIRFECSTVWRVQPLVDTLQSISGLFCATISSPRRVPGQQYPW